MSELVSCTGCARHVRANEHACPFCGAEVRRRPQDLRVARGATRAAIFYAGLALAGCDGGTAAIYGGPPEPETIMQPYGAPPDPEPPQDPPPPPETDTPTVGSPTTIAQPYGAPPPPPPPEETTPPAVAAPYGAPPMPTPPDPPERPDPTRPE